MPAPLNAHGCARAAAHKSKLVSADEAVRLIHSGDTVATGGFVGITGLRRRSRLRWRSASESEQAPRPDTGLCRRARRRQHRGLNHLVTGAAESVIGGHWGWCPNCRSAGDGGRDRSPQPAAGRDHPSVPRYCRWQTGLAFTRVGFGTFVDPRHGGGKVNARTTEELGCG